MHTYVYVYKYIFMFCMFFLKVECWGPAWGLILYELKECGAFKVD